MNQPVSRSRNRPVEVCIKRERRFGLDFLSHHVMASPNLDGSIDLHAYDDRDFIRLPKAVVEAVVQLHGRISALEADQKDLGQAYLNGELVEDVAVVSAAAQPHIAPPDADGQEAAP